MNDWSKILKSNVIRTFREICYKWWGSDIQLFDNYGNRKNNGIAFKNPLCHLMHSTQLGTNSCLRCYRKCLRELNKSPKPFNYKCYAGLSGIAVPIFLKGKYIGAMICSGIYVSDVEDQRQEIYIRELTRHGFDKTVVGRCYNNLRRINSHSEKYITESMKIVSEDVEVFFETLQENVDLIKKQKSLQEMARNEKHNGIIGLSPPINNIFDTLELIKSAENPVLLEGETGTGKELFAAAIHYNSPRKDEAFVIQNCSAFHDTLLCSELFGHEKGSFTGAVSEKKGLFEIADGGTIFLDEIGDMKMEIQSKLLRILEDGTFYRVGGTAPKKVDVRVIAATNKEVKKQVEQGLFRKDLFYRINAITINIPPLRERKEDIKPLANFFLESYGENRNEESKHLSHEVIERLDAYNWPGNIRELKNLIERLVVLSGKNNTIGVDLLPGEIRDFSPGLPAGNIGNGSKLRDALQAVEKKLTGDALKRMKWNKTLASRELGISRASLNNRIARFDIQPTLS